MQLNITFRNFDASEPLKSYAREKLEKVQKYLNHAVEAHVVLTLERHLHHADVTLSAGPFVLRATEASADMYSSLDLAVDKLEEQLRRTKDRRKHYHGQERVHHRQAMLKPRGADEAENTPAV